MNEHLKEMLRYNAWADARLFEHCSGLTEEEFDAGLPGQDGTLRIILQHLATAPEAFARRIQGGDPVGAPPGPWPGIEALAKESAANDAVLLDLASTHGMDDEIDLPFMGTWVRFPRRFFFTHAIAHGTLHREQACVILATLGKPLDRDGWQYAEVMKYGGEVAGPGRGT